MSDYTRARWNEIKSLRPSSVMTHVSKTFRPNPLIAICEQQGIPFNGPRFLPNPGVTLNLGRNKAKRVCRRKTGLIA